MATYMDILERLDNEAREEFDGKVEFKQRAAVEVVRADDRVLISLELVNSACGAFLDVSGDEVIIKSDPPTRYKVVGWEPKQRALKCRRLT